MECFQSRKEANLLNPLKDMLRGSFKQRHHCDFAGEEKGPKSLHANAN